MKPSHSIFRTGRSLVWAGIGAFFLLGTVSDGMGAEPRHFLHGHVPAVVSRLQSKGLLPATNQLQLSIGLPLRDEAGLDEFIHQLYDPGSTNFHRFITSPEFTARFGPTEADYRGLIQFAEANGFTVVGTHGNRLVLDVEGSVSNVEQEFQVTLHTYKHPVEPRDFFAPDTEPSVPANLPVVTVEGLSDYWRPHPLAHPVRLPKSRPLSFNGSGPNNEYAGRDFRNAYAPGTTLTGTGQSVALLEFSGYYQVDIVNYENAIGLTNHVPLNNIRVGRQNPGTANNDEVALDIEMAIAMAPGLSQVVVYEEATVNPSSILGRMATDNLAKQLSSSWSWGGGPDATVDSLFLQMAAQGQSFFQASGDSDAYTGGQALDNSGQSTAPLDSTNLTCVGGTTVTMNGTGASWASETVWNYNADPISPIPNEGSGGGISIYYTIPYWQASIIMANNAGSTTHRNVPDVALTADNIFVSYNNGDATGTYYFMGTSCAAPLWAGFCALVNQQSVTLNGTTVGFLNPAIYAIGSGPNYAACFHDTATGNNIGTNTPGLFNAVAGYDLCTGWGTPNGTNLINALTLLRPYFINQPTNETVVSGGSTTFNAAAGGLPPFSYRWLFNGTNLHAGGNVSGTSSSTLSITAATTGNAGNYRLIVTNTYGSVTSSVAVLTVVLPPAITGPLASQTIQCGGNATFAITASGTPPLSYQWRIDGSPISGATSNSVSLTNVHLPGHTVGVTVTNLYASATSNATLSVQDTNPPVITLNGGNPIFVELGSGFTDPGATANDTCAGVVPVTVSGSVNTGSIGTNTLTYTANDGNGNTNTATRTVIVRDTTPPKILWSFTNLVLAANTNCSAAMPDVTGTNFILATDLSGALAISQSPTNDFILPLGTNVVVLTVADASGNTASSTNMIVVTDQSPPQILSQPQNQTNLVGTTASFSVAATACTPLAYQWFFNSAALANQTNNTLTLASVNLTNAGYYSVTVTASGGLTNSAVATLTVFNPTPVIASVVANPGGSFTLNLAGAPGSTYVLETTTNLVPVIIWLPIATNQLDASGVWQFTDPQAVNFVQQFYRLELAP